MFFCDYFFIYLFWFYFYFSLKIRYPDALFFPEFILIYSSVSNAYSYDIDGLFLVLVANLFFCFFYLYERKNYVGFNELVSLVLAILLIWLFIQYGFLYVRIILICFF